MGRNHSGTDAATAQSADPAAPLEAFSRCHEGILARIQAFSGLPALVEAAARARAVAADTVSLFEDVVLAHHADEESELFPAVLRWSVAGKERDHVEALVRRLTAEHRALEKLWRAQRSAVEAAARGKPTDLDGKATLQLAHAYAEHAGFEEQAFLPIAQEILARDSAHLASLGLSLHMRHAPVIPGYI